MVALASNAHIGGTGHARILGRRRLRLLVDLSAGLRRPLADRDRPLPLAGSPLVEGWPEHHAGRRSGAARAVRPRGDRHRRIPAAPSGARWTVSIVLTVVDGPSGPHVAGDDQDDVSRLLLGFDVSRCLDNLLERVATVDHRPV